MVNEDECVLTIEGKQKDAGTYTATVSSVSNPNYVLPADSTAIFTINPKPLSKDMLKVDSDSIKADGTEKGPNITMKDMQLETVMSEEDYILSGDQTAVEVGTYFITISGIGNYTDSLETSWVLHGEKKNSDRLEPEGDKGALEIFVDIEGNTENISVDNFDLDFAISLLTEEDLARYNNGESVLIYVELFEEDKDIVLIDDELLIEDLFKHLGTTDFRWFDITIWKKIGNDAAIQVHEMKEPIEMSIDIPDEYQVLPKNTTREFYIARSHNGEAALLGNTNKFTINLRSDKFSTFALAYKDTAKGSGSDDRKDSTKPYRIPNTGVESRHYDISFALLLGVSAIFTYQSKKRRKDCK